MPELTLPDLTLHYEVDGDGPPLLLLAGMLSDSATWAGFTPLLSDHFTVIRPDNRTTGRTVPRDAPADVVHMIADALALMDHLGHGAFHVAGHSLGGLMSLELAALMPERVATVGVFASGRIRVPRTMAVFDALLAIRRAPQGERLWLQALHPWIFGNGFFEDADATRTAIVAALGYPHMQTVDAMTLQIEAFRAFRPKARMAEIACPTLVAYAGQDLLVPPALAQPSFANLPDLHEVTFPDAGHSIVWDAPDALADHLLHFLGKHPIR